MKAMIATGICAAALAAAANADVEWTCSTEDVQWQTMEATGGVQDGALTISVDPSVRYQKMDSHPWGGCFNEQGWYAMRELSDAEKKAVVARLYGKGPNSLGFTAGRMSIGSSDYGVIHYSYDETKGDYALKDFSIERDRLYMLPYIKSALAKCPDMFLFGSPWTPPSWLKTTGLLHGRLGPAPRFIMTKENLDVYARYFVKYLEAYAKEGISIGAVTPQNEPTMNTAYPSCVWTGEELHEFLKGYLAPAVKAYNAKNGKAVEVWLGTFTDSNPSLCMPTTEDPEMLKDLGAVCFQWWGANLARRVRRMHEGLKTVQSETKCGNGNNDWAYAEEQFDCFKEFLDAGVSQYFLWNMILDSRGLNNAYTKGKWSQNAPITVDGRTVKIRPSYYLTKHFSVNVKPGARRLKTWGEGLGEGSVARYVKDVRAIAFQNPDGTIVVNVKNSTDEENAVTLAVDGLAPVSVVLPAHSISTFKFAGVKFEDTPDATYDPGQDKANADAVVVKFAEAEGGDLVSVKDASFADGAEIDLQANKGEGYQSWKLVPAGEGCYNIVNANSGLALGVSAGSREIGAKVVQWTGDGSINQQWRLVPTGKDIAKGCFLANRDTGMCLTRDQDGTMCVKPFVAANGQIFKIDVVSGELK